MYSFKVITIIVSIIIVVNCTQLTTTSTSTTTNDNDGVGHHKQKNNHILKRSLSSQFGGGGDSGDDIFGGLHQISPSKFHPWHLSAQSLSSSTSSLAAGSDSIIGSSRPYGPPSPMEVANAIAMAKQASTNVLIAQQQVQAAKDNVLHQQKLASEKETHATLLTQKSEAAAAIQRSEAASAAQAVILAQQRLASAKNSVSQQQRIASAKEAIAAAALQSSARAAAEEIHRTEQEATRLANAQRSGSAAFAHHLTATKDSIVQPLHTGNNHVPNNLAADLSNSLYGLSGGGHGNLPWNGPISTGAGNAGGINNLLWPSSVYISPTLASPPIHHHSIKPIYNNLWG